MSVLVAVSGTSDSEGQVPEVAKGAANRSNRPDSTFAEGTETKTQNLRPQVAETTAVNPSDLQQSNAQVDAFLDAYRKLRVNPRLKLFKYAENRTVEWRCLIHATDPTGLPIVFVHLPASSQGELELMIETADKNLASQIWPVLQRRKSEGLETSLEVTVTGQIINYFPSSPAIKGSPQNPPRVDLVNAQINEMDPSNSYRTRSGARGADVVAAARFLADWKSLDQTDPTGVMWLTRKLSASGYESDHAIRWHCVLADYSNTFNAKFFGASEGDPTISVSTDDSDAIEAFVDRATYDTWNADHQRGELALPPQTLSSRANTSF